ncbi:hypothetical protein DLAC_08832 [Tieghemostelium lacteum]|uniref:F-box domain-containing protein n=1 Tax=Tieghemostelium lacteum TaxID=361077 RepID=A0A151Z8G0_TIELA|nr:hypothetical protein DLAC_08832 [Tieghemostelium lacteum]|eukprot:KYQ90231.1 hypothetical protein DLAC_08832 [Tieghemostelium lacteum]
MNNIFILPLPNYIILDILNILVKITKHEKLIYELIRKLSLVCKEWNEKFLPRIEFDNLRVAVNSNKEMLGLKPMLMGKIGGYYLDIQCDKLEMAKVREFMSDISLPKSKLKSIRVLLYIDKPKSIETIRFFEDTLGGVNNFSFMTENVVKTDEFYPFANLQEIIQPFIHLKTIDLSSMSLDSQDIINSIELIRPISLQLKSTPYGYGGPKDCLDVIYNYMATNNTITDFAVFNYFYISSKSAVVEMLNNNKTLTDVCLCNLTSEQLDSKIFNETLTKMYIDKNVNTYWDMWGCPSALHSMTFEAFTDKDKTLVVEKHYKRLKSVVINVVEDQQALLDLIKSKCSFTHLRISREFIPDSIEGFIEALESNTVLDFLEFYAPSMNINIIREIIAMNKPSLKHLVVQIPELSDDLLSLEEVIISNPYLRKLKFIKSTKFSHQNIKDRLFEYVINILENTNIIALDLPFLTNSSMATPEFIENISKLLEKKYDYTRISISNEIYSTSPFKNLLKSKLIEG